MVVLIYKSSLLKSNERHIENNIVQIFCKCTIHTLQQRQVCCLYGFLIQFSKSTIIRTWRKSRKKKRSAKAFLKEHSSNSIRFYIVCILQFAQDFSRRTRRARADEAEHTWVCEHRIDPSSNTVTREKDKWDIIFFKSLILAQDERWRRA